MNEFGGADILANRILFGTKLMISDRICVEMLETLGICIFAGLTKESFDLNLDVVKSGDKVQFYFIGNRPMLISDSMERIMDYIRDNYHQDLIFLLFHQEILRGEFSYD